MVGIKQNPRDISDLGASFTDAEKVPMIPLPKIPANFDGADTILSNYY